MAGKKRKPTTAKTGQPTRRKIVPAGPKQTGISWPETVIFLFIVAEDMLPIDLKNNFFIPSHIGGV